MQLLTRLSGFRKVGASTVLITATMVTLNRPVQRGGRPSILPFSVLFDFSYDQSTPAKETEV